MLRPFDLLARATAIPAIVWSVSAALLDVGRRAIDDPLSTPFTRDMFDGFFEQIERQCRSRWAGAFEPIEHDQPHSRAA